MQRAVKVGVCMLSRPALPRIGTSPTPAISCFIVAEASVAETADSTVSPGWPVARVDSTASLEQAARVDNMAFAAAVDSQCHRTATASADQPVVMADSMAFAAAMADNMAAAGCYQ